MLQAMRGEFMIQELSLSPPKTIWPILCGRVSWQIKMEYLPEFELLIARLDERIQPVAKRPFDFNDPGFRLKLANASDPLDETGTRAALETLVTKITDHYADCSPEIRLAIRALFEKYDSLSWAAAFSRFPATRAGVRRELLLFSVLDQGKDARDAILWLGDIIARARRARILIKPLLEEAAAISNDTDKCGMGSTKSLLQTQASGLPD